MGEAQPNTGSPNPSTPSKVPAEIQDQITKEQILIGKMTKDELITRAKEMGLVYDPEKVNEKWLQRKLKYTVQEQILKQNGLTESPTIKKNREKVDADNPEAPSTVGRKRMTTAGNYTLQIPDGGNEGRANTTKGKVVAHVKALGTFTYAQFKEGVSLALGWNEESAAFSENTRFRTLDLAAGAWWSELKNKAKIIVEAPIA